MTVLETRPGSESRPPTQEPGRRSREPRERQPLNPLAIGLMILAALAGWVVLFLGPLSGLYEVHSQAKLYSQFRDELSSGTTPPPPFSPTTPLVTGDPVALLNSSALGLTNEVVVEGTRAGQLQKGPGHLPGTVLPGEAGQSWILGRTFAFGGPFGRLSTVKPGALIAITTGQGKFTYKVVDSRGPGQPIPGSLAATPNRLVLVTAANDSWRNLWTPTHAIYVDAVLQGKALAVAQGTAQVAADEPMAIDTSGLTILVLWLELLLVAVAAVSWAVVKWGRRQAWLIGIPFVIAALWGASLTASQLLPNLM